MIFEPGVWVGRGSWRDVQDSTGIRFDASLVVSDQDQHLTIDVAITTIAMLRYEFGIWITPDETGLYEIVVMGSFVDLRGFAKLDSVPHLIQLESDDRSVQVATTVFTMPEVRGVRGFIRNDKGTLTFEVALQPEHETVEADNIVALDQHRRRRRR